MKKWIVFDVDDVICNFRESLYQSFKIKGIDFHWSEWSSYNLTANYKFEDDNEFIRHMLDSQVVENAAIEEYVKEFFENLKNHGYHIGLLTARGWHHEGFKVTEHFVRSNGLTVDKIVLSSSYHDRKSAYLKEFEGEVKGYIDDSIRHIVDFISLSVPNVYLLDRPWNQENRELPRVNSLKEFSNIILETS